MKKALLAALVLLAGCAGRQRYIEGTHLALGAYVPGEDGIYGVEIAQYTAGAYFSAATNTPCRFEREFSATNSWFWGALESVETSRTKLVVEVLP